MEDRRSFTPHSKLEDDRSIAINKDTKCLVIDVACELDSGYLLFVKLINVVSIWSIAIPDPNFQRGSFLCVVMQKLRTGFAGLA
jgi:hypothetical protein